MSVINLEHMRYSFEIIPAKGKTNSFRLHLHLRRDLRNGDALTILVHEQLYKTREDAKRLAVRIARKCKVDLAHWIWSSNKDSSIEELHVKPTARYKTQPVEVKDHV